MNLFNAQCNKKYLVKSINEDEGIERRLESLGHTENSPIELINRKRGGAAIVRIRGTRFALGREICEGIELWGENT